MDHPEVAEELAALMAQEQAGAQAQAHQGGAGEGAERDGRSGDQSTWLKNRRRSVVTWPSMRREWTSMYTPMS